MTQMRSVRNIWFFRIVLLCVVALLFVWPLIACAIFLTWVFYVFGDGTYYQAYQGPSLERALGFEHGTRYRSSGHWWHEALAIRTVVEGGVFATAGFRAGDVLPGWSFTEFFRHLHRNRGQVVELEVSEGCPEGDPLQIRPRRSLCFVVPALSEARPTRDDFLACVSSWAPLGGMTVGGVIGHIISLVTLPSGPLWAHIVITYLLAGAGFHLALHCPYRRWS